MGLITLEHVGSSQIRAWTCLSFIGKQFISIRLPGKTTHCFLKDLLKQSASFLFPCGLLFANCSLLYLHVFQTSHWPTLFISRVLCPCQGHLCLSWSWSHKWCSPHLGNECMKGCRVFRANIYVIICRTKSLLAHLNENCMRWVWGFLLWPFFFFFFNVEVVTTFLISQDTFCQAKGK